MEAGGKCNAVATSMHDNLQFHGGKTGVKTMFRSFDMARLVANEVAIPTDVAIFA